MNKNKNIATYFWLCLTKLGRKTPFEVTDPNYFANGQLYIIKLILEGHVSIFITLDFEAVQSLTAKSKFKTFNGKIMASNN
jgi:hypothetical protein